MACDACVEIKLTKLDAINYQYRRIYQSYYPDRLNQLPKSEVSALNEKAIQIMNEPCDKCKPEMCEHTFVTKERSRSVDDRIEGYEIPVCSKCEYEP